MATPPHCNNCGKIFDCNTEIIPSSGRLLCPACAGVDPCLLLLNVDSPGCILCGQRFSNNASIYPNPSGKRLFCKHCAERPKACASCWGETIDKTLYPSNTKQRECLSESCGWKAVLSS